MLPLTKEDLTWIFLHFYFKEVMYRTKILHLEPRGQLPITLKQGLIYPSITKENPPAIVAPFVTSILLTIRSKSYDNKINQNSLYIHK